MYNPAALPLFVSAFTAEEKVEALENKIASIMDVLEMQDDYEDDSDSEDDTDDSDSEE